MAQRHDKLAPLALRMRPRSLDEVLGQDHLLASGAPLRRLVEGGGVASVLLVGPPGVGKTTLALLLSQATDRRFVELSATSAGVKDVRAVIEDARRVRDVDGQASVLFIDEIHRFSKTQQDALLPAVEHRWVTLVGATTESPFHALVAPLVSRSLLLTLHPLDDDDVRSLLARATRDERGLAGRVRVADDATEALIRLAGGDARRGLTLLDAAADAALSRQGADDRAGAAALGEDAPPLGAVDPDATSQPEPPIPTVTVADVTLAADRTAIRYDRAGDQHYDVTSALIKSVRGSDVDAALHYLARMAEAGEDPRFLARRLVILASEDIGMADPTALHTAVAALQAVSLVGWPEARISLAQAVIHLATAPKSNAVIQAVDAAIADVRAGRLGAVPAHLRDAHDRRSRQLGHGVGYIYPHDDPRGVVAQQYAPDPVRGRRYYQPTTRGAERALAERLARLRAVVDGEVNPDGPVSSS